MTVAATPLVTPRCRPSELPTTLALDLNRAARAEARARAHLAGLQTPVWLRTAVEAVRQLDAIQMLFDMPAAIAITTLDTSAAANQELALISDTALAAYSRALRSPPTAHSGTDTGQTVVVEVPDEYVCAWRLAALRGEQTLDTWASAAVLRAPANVISWEIAAARRGAYLGEWMLACCAAAKRDSARPQACTAGSEQACS